MANPFRRRSGGPTLTREAAERQGRILQVAIATLGAGEAMVFLNTQHDELGGRPLDLAIATPEGFARIETFLRARAPG